MFLEIYSVYTQSEKTSGRRILSCFALFFGVCVVSFRSVLLNFLVMSHSLYGLRTNTWVSTYECWPKSPKHLRAFLVCPHRLVPGTKPTLIVECRSCLAKLREPSHVLHKVGCSVLWALRAKARSAQGSLLSVSHTSSTVWGLLRVTWSLFFALETILAQWPNLCPLQCPTRQLIKTAVRTQENSRSCLGTLPTPLTPHPSNLSFSRQPFSYLFFVSSRLP